jgi:hypothetical protein
MPPKKKTRAPARPCASLTVPELEQSKTAVLSTLPSTHSRRSSVTLFLAPPFSGVKQLIARSRHGRGTDSHPGAGQRRNVYLLVGFFFPEWGLLGVHTYTRAIGNSGGHLVSSYASCCSQIGREFYEATFPTSSLMLPSGGMRCKPVNITPPTSSCRKLRVPLCRHFGGQTDRSPIRPSDLEGGWNVRSGAGSVNKG